MGTLLGIGLFGIVLPVALLLWVGASAGAGVAEELQRMWTTGVQTRQLPHGSRVTDGDTVVATLEHVIIVRTGSDDRLAQFVVSGTWLVSGRARRDSAYVGILEPLPTGRHRWRIRFERNAGNLPPRVGVLRLAPDTAFFALHQEPAAVP